ncbi:MAG: LysM domain-containing protein [Chloroflexota bacterium]
MPTEAPTAEPSTAPKPSASGVPSASRLAVLKPCPGKTGCYIYAIRSGDNLFSIAHWFGVPLDTVYAWNPTVKKTGIHPGMEIKIPTPTR